jgi:hypothetical protein
LFQTRRRDPRHGRQPSFDRSRSYGNTLLVKDLERLAEMVHAATGE